LSFFLLQAGIGTLFLERDVKQRGLRNPLPNPGGLMECENDVPIAGSCIDLIPDKRAVRRRVVLTIVKSNAGGIMRDCGENGIRNMIRGSIATAVNLIGGSGSGSIGRLILSIASITKSICVAGEACRSCRRIA